jgi:hypothetical protein
MIRGLIFWRRRQPRLNETSPTDNANEQSGQSPDDKSPISDTRVDPTTARLAAADAALDGLVKAWTEQSRTNAPPHSYLSAEIIAQLFASGLRAQDTLWRHGIASNWVRENYPQFCNSLHLYDPPPYKDFAHELAKVLPRRRREHRENGKRIKSSTYYSISSP